MRCALLKQQRQLSYEELAFHREASTSFCAFARLPLAWSPKKSVLHQTISALRPATWEAVNRALVARAKQEKLEAGAMVRIDSTVTEALMHEPSDSALLWDAVRARDPDSDFPCNGSASVFDKGPATLLPRLNLTHAASLPIGQL